ncbi:hypothetical protein [Candidatus Tisiphia endosymbiont of Parasteatoda lunata]
MAKKLDTDKDTLDISNQLVEELLSKAVHRSYLVEMVYFNS